SRHHAAHSLPPISSSTLSQILSLSHGRSSLHCISAAEQPPLPLHGSPPPTLPLRRRSQPLLPLPSFSAPSLISWLHLSSCVGPWRGRGRSDPLRNLRPWPFSSSARSSISHWLAPCSSPIHDKQAPEHSVHQTMSSNLGLQAMIALAVVSRCLPCQERLSVNIFYLKVWRSRNASFSGGLPSRKSV
ncbi:unnamed protein product, partial [Urochloa humidicola]